MVDKANANIFHYLFKCKFAALSHIIMYVHMQRMCVSVCGCLYYCICQ